MLDQMTMNKLYEMKLRSMAEAFRNQIQDQALAGLSFEERFGLIVDSEWAKRKNNRLARLIRNADLSENSACIENVEYAADRKLDKTQISSLATCNYIQEKHNIIILGAAGAGKSYLGCAFGVAACRNFFAAKYIRLPELLNDLALARGEGTYKKISLLVLDEWLLIPLSSLEARDLLEIVEARHKRASTIFISQFAPQGWHSKIG
jgi:DNA replication protein DnaC